MSKRAEEAAWAANDSYHDDAWRVIFMQGYRQAEKDNELTINDIKFIIDKYSELPIQYGPRLFNEILVQFNKQKQK